MKKIEGQMSFEINPEEEGLKEKNQEEKKKELKKDSDKLDKRDKKKTEDRIRVESVEKTTDELTGELCYRIILFWEVVQRPLGFVYYPKDGKVRWTFRPNFHISDKWWRIMIQRVRAVGSDHYRRYKREIEG